MKKNLLQSLADKLHPTPRVFSEDMIDTDAFRRLPFSERIRVLVCLAGEKDRQHAISGAKTHHYRFNPTASVQEVRQFEAELGITLPESYFRFLTEIGNGGAGPDYGLYSLEQMRSCNEHLLWQLPFGETYLDSALTQEKWNAFIKTLDAEEEDEAIEALIGRMFHGALVISTHGCSYDTVLMCSGSHEGKLFDVCWDLEEENRPHIIEKTFEEWMETYFLKIVQGDVIVTDNGLKFVKH